MSPPLGMKSDFGFSEGRECREWSSMDEACEDLQRNPKYLELIETERKLMDLKREKIPELCDFYLEMGTWSSFKEHME